MTENIKSQMEFLVLLAFTFVANILHVYLWKDVVIQRIKKLFQPPLLQELLHNIHVYQSVVWLVSLNYVQSTQHSSGISFKFSELWFLQESILILFSVQIPNSIDIDTVKIGQSKCLSHSCKEELRRSFTGVRKNY